MATLDRQLPSPDTFLYKPWSTFISAAKLHYSDKMHVYGQYPTQEDFCLVVCHVCNQVVKPQGILTHYGKTSKPKQHTTVKAVTTNLTFHSERLATLVTMCLRLV
uniref:Ataxin-7-like protein 1 n=1 Tax=Esox lucius TaxID=8010 RepID=A0AAY5K0H3_ESOLU